MALVLGKSTFLHAYLTEADGDELEDDGDGYQLEPAACAHSFHAFSFLRIDEEQRDQLTQDDLMNSSSEDSIWKGASEIYDFGALNDEDQSFDVFAEMKTRQPDEDELFDELFDRFSKARPDLEPDAIRAVIATFQNNDLELSYDEYMNTDDEECLSDTLWNSAGGIFAEIKGCDLDSLIASTQAFFLLELDDDYFTEDGNPDAAAIAADWDDMEVDWDSFEKYEYTSYAVLDHEEDEDESEEDE